MRRSPFAYAVLTMIGAASAFAQPAPSPPPSEGLELLKQVAKPLCGGKVLLHRVSGREYIKQRIQSLLATAIVAAIGNGAAFHKRREFSSWLGPVPRQHSTGGKARLFGISKRGNNYLRKILVQWCPIRCTAREARTVSVWPMARCA